jgi:ATPase subunit of ABC transporter with duplicated ATPase domains
MNEVTFGYVPEKVLLKGINFDIGLDSRIAIVGANGAGRAFFLFDSLYQSSDLQLGKSTLYVFLPVSQRFPTDLMCLHITESNFSLRS